MCFVAEVGLGVNDPKQSEKGKDGGELMLHKVELGVLRLAYPEQIRPLKVLLQRFPTANR